MKRVYVIGTQSKRKAVLRQRYFMGDGPVRYVNTVPHTVPTVACGWFLLILSPCAAWNVLPNILPNFENGLSDMQETAA